MKRRYRLEDLGGDVSIILEWVFKKYGVKVWTGLNWLRIESGGGLLWNTVTMIGFHKMQVIS
jgi:hypothetical protein